MQAATSSCWNQKHHYNWLESREGSEVTNCCRLVQLYWIIALIFSYSDLSAVFRKVSMLSFDVRKPIVFFSPSSEGRLLFCFTGWFLNKGAELTRIPVGLCFLSQEPHRASPQNNQPAIQIKSKINETSDLIFRGCCTIVNVCYQRGNEVLFIVDKTDMRWNMPLQLKHNDTFDNYSITWITQ